MISSTVSPGHLRLVGSGLGRLGASGAFVAKQMRKNVSAGCFDDLVRTMAKIREMEVEERVSKCAQLT